jgi:transposase
MQIKQWHKYADELKAKGYPSRKISKMIGKSKSAINDYFAKKKATNFGSLPINADVNGPKILFIDIELKPILAQVWQLWDNNVGLPQIQEDWSILSFCAKWGHSEEIIYHDLSEAEDFEDDYELLEILWDLLNEADFVVGQNSKRFDVKKINARLILNGFPKPSSFRQIDTFEIAKRQFGFTSNKLQYMTEKLCKMYKKRTHQQFPGHLLWSECLKGNPEAWKEMRDYNIDDVRSLEELYGILASWDNTLPNFDVYIDAVPDMSEWIEDGFVYTNLGKFQRYRNLRTGVQRKGRTNLLSKEKRTSLLANIT